MNASPSVSRGLFRPGDRWLAIGDSITQHAGYQAAIHLYYATRFPEHVLEPANAGIVGDFAGGALERYDWDIAPSSATIATVMFGMNDVGQELYDTETPTLEQRERRRIRLLDYQTNLARLTDRLRRDGARVVLISPSIFDETALGERPTRPGINSALADCTARMRRLATEQGHAFVDLHTPMTALNGHLQSADPSATIVGPDRIHPGPAGHLLMAYHILKAQGAPALVSRVELDASAGEVLAAENATVENLAASPAGLSFTVHARALPYPVFDDAAIVPSWVPFHDILDREILRVTGLAAGRHALLVDGVEAGRYASEKLAAGLNLALVPGTPQMRQAAAVGERVRKWQQLLSLNLRRIAMVEYWHLRDLPRPVDFDAARQTLEAKLASVENLDAYTRAALAGYLEAKPAEEAARHELAALLSQIRIDARPRPHAYRIVHLPGR